MFLQSGYALMALVISSSAMPFSKRAENQVVSGALATDTVTNSDGGAAADSYTFFQGDGSTGAGWPAKSDWASFDSLWAANSAVMPNVCGWNGFSTSEDSASEIQAIYNAIQSVAAATKVDHRFILAVMMQESKGCVRVNTTGNGVRNPGLMQDHDGPHSCNDGGNVQVPCPDAEIQGMIQDGTGGTAAGDGLAATLNQAEGLGKTDAQGFYAAARIYNSGSIDPSGNLGAGGSTHCYASDIANRLKGWVLAPDTCTA